MTEKPDDLKSKLGNWLERQGYPLEMSVARAFRKSQFRTAQSEFYDDPETSKPREIDVLASMVQYAQGIIVAVEFCVECKLAKDKPWVIFGPSIQLPERERTINRVASALGTDLLNRTYDREDIRNLPAFQTPAPGYGVTQAFAAGEDIPYKAVMSAAKAAIAKAKKADEGSQKYGPVCHIDFPVVVIDGRLFMCYLDDAGKMITDEIQTGTLMWRNPTLGTSTTIVQIVTLPDIDKFVLGARETASALLQTCEGELSDLAKTLPKGAPRWSEQNVAKGA